MTGTFTLADIASGYCHLPPSFTPIVHDCWFGIKQFFLKDTKYKQQFQYDGQIEYGYYHLGHKEYFAVRNQQLPVELQACQHLYAHCYSMAAQILTRIAVLMNWESSALSRLIQAGSLPLTGKSSSVLRLLSYYPQTTKDIACDVHQDLGLISILFATDVNALESFNFVTGDWEDLELGQVLLTPIVMIGETLSFLSNGKLISANHRVRTPAVTRTSMVFQLRADPQVVLDAKDFENEVTGKYNKAFQLTGDGFYQQEITRRRSVNNSY